MTSSQDGRRVIVAPVTGEIGDRIQAWREQHDPQQARRLPPHATMMYWAIFEDADLDAVERQIRHAFPAPVTVRLNDVHVFANPDRTRYVQVSDTDELDAARARLFDGTHYQFPEQRTEWDWHVTVVRYGSKADESMIDAAVGELNLFAPWTVDTLLWLELRDGVYQEVGRWGP